MKGRVGSPWGLLTLGLDILRTWIARTGIGVWVHIGYSESLNAKNSKANVGVFSRGMKFQSDIPTPDNRQPIMQMWLTLHNFVSGRAPCDQPRGRKWLWASLADKKLTQYSKTGIIRKAFRFLSGHKSPGKGACYAGFSGCGKQEMSRLDVVAVLVLSDLCFSAA